MEAVDEALLHVLQRVHLLVTLLPHVQRCRLLDGLDNGHHTLDGRGGGGAGELEHVRRR